MAVRSKGSTKKVAKGSGAVSVVQEYVGVKKLKEMYAAKEAELRERLLEIAAEQGEPDDKGSNWFELPEEVEGFGKIYRQRRTSQQLQEDVAERELTKLGLWDECTTQITVTDEDAILALGFDKTIPDAVMKKLYVEKTSYALYLK